MGVNRKALVRLLRSRVVWPIAALAVGTLLGWVAVSASADADRAGQAYPGRVVTSAIAGADVLLPSSAIGSSSPPNAAFGGSVVGSSSLALAASLAFIIAALFAVSRGARRVRRLPVAAFRGYLDIDL